MHTTTGVGYSKFVESFRSSPFLCHPCHSLQHQSDRLASFPYAKTLFQKQIQSNVRDYISKPRNHSFIHSFISTLHSIIIIIIIVIMVVSPHCCLVLLYCCCVCCAVVVFVVQLQLFSGEEASQAGLTQCRLDVL